MRLILKPWGLGLLFGSIAVLAILLAVSSVKPTIFVPISRQGKSVLVMCEGCGHEIPVSAEELKRAGTEAAVAAVNHDTLWEKQGVLRVTAGDARTDGARLVAAPPVPGFRGTGALEFGGTRAAAHWVVNAPAPGAYRLSLRYANPEGDAVSLRVFHQDAGGTGKVIASGLAAPRTGEKRPWEYLSLPVTLTAGDNLLRVATTGEGRLYVDGIVLERTVSSPPATP
jgi:hypothetical protein